MPDLRALAAACGVRVEVADLGGWGSATLRAEYDARERTIRVNLRALPHDQTKAEHAIARAIAHELYHHREARGEVPRLAGRDARERAAEAYADQLTEPD
jgi:hypothetical protein